MKNLNIKLVLIAMVLMFFTVISAAAQVGIGTTTPNASSMLDVQSNAKGVLIPRMLTSERDAISNPANGLLVFDTTSNSFWYYKTDTWKELVGSNSLVDADGDTKIEVEKTTDVDEINFTTSGAERMKIDDDGEILMGVDLDTQATTTFQIDTDGVIKLGNKGASTLTGGTKGGNESDTTSEENYTKITADGSLSYVGNATRWDDLKVPVNSLKIRDKNAGVDIDPASWDYFIGETALLWFEDKAVNGEQSVTFTVQMPHAWKEGTNIFPHVHWTSKTAPGNSRVTWGLEYSWISVGGEFPNTVIITGSAVATPNSGSIVAQEHVITPLGSGGIDGSGKTLSSMLVCRLFRNSSAGTDDFTGDAGLLEFDFHYQIDSDGSNQEYEKE